MDALLPLALIAGLVVFAALAQLGRHELPEYKPREFWSLYYGGDGGDFR